jgi:gliding motility-associated-like protein
MRFCLVAIIFMLAAFKVASQCTASISNFPHTQDFEASTGGWTTGGSASDWAYGTPNKLFISGAASGAKCWVVGTLVSNSYAGGENSWLMSPCYDFTNLSAPLVQFKVFWDTERRWDGASMDYSLDGGNTWIRAGAVVDSSACYTMNWFNFSTINNVGEGWSGTVKPTIGNCLGGGGMNQWVDARHQFLNLAGKPSVRFRFTFTAGTTCNNYDGFGVDDFTVSNTPTPFADFEYFCEVNNAISFANKSFICGGTYLWNFGDALSGSSNTSTAKDPQHTFSSPGTYTISLVAPTNPAGQSFTTTKQVVILGVSAAKVSNITCYNASTGSITASGSGSTGAYTYSWNTTPPRQGATVNNLAAGTYIVTVNGGTACPASASITLVNPAPLSHAVAITDASCGRPNGSATINEAGGTAPYTNVWTPAVGAGATASNLAAGNYVVDVKDANRCADSIHISIQNINGLQLAIDTVKNVSCFGGTDGAASIIASGGIGGYTYQWTPAGGSAATAASLNAGTYTVTVTDGGGCTGAKTMTITQPPKLTISLGNDAVICPGTKLVLDPGNFATYRWQDNSVSPSFEVKGAGKYWVEVANSSGCIAADTISVTTECNDIVFPTVFTPNGDNKNDLFKPLGTLSEVRDYRLSIYNRWGQLVFASGSPYQGWNGRLKGVEIGTGAFTWIAEFSFNNQPRKLMKGVVVILK